MVVLYFIFFIIAISFESRDIKNRNMVMAFACTVLAIAAGMRDLSWSDTGVYMISFTDYTPTLFDFSFSDRPLGYGEKGFYFLAICVKTLTDNYHIFFLVVAAISFIALYKDIKEFSVFPLVGLFAYIARFLIGRNFIQIRAGLAYAILMISIKYILEKDWKRYFILVFIAWLFHRSCIVAIPLYFICNWIKVKKWHIIVGVGVSFLIGAFGQGFMHALVEDNASDLNIGIRYTDAGGEKRQLEGLGLLNPMIYFQCILLFAYTFLEKKLAPISKYYYIIRTAYLYSTMILICFCTYKVLSARTSSMYATLEFAIIPSLIYLFNKKNRMFAFLATGIILTGIFYLYYSRSA